MLYQCGCQTSQLFDKLVQMRRSIGYLPVGAPRGCTNKSNVA
jgi:hypothetical protein